MTLQLGVIISGRGSNMLAIQQAIEQKQLDANIAVVISNKANAKGLEIAQEHGIPTKAILPANYADQPQYEQAILNELLNHKVELVILAGYLKIIGQTLLQAFPNKIMNIHPSLLPSFKGLHAHKQALDYGVKFSGCSVHFVDASLDGGPIILQDVVPVLPGDTEDTLSMRILEKEHLLYPKAIKLYSENKLG